MNSGLDELSQFGAVERCEECGQAVCDCDEGVPSPQEDEVPSQGSNSEVERAGKRPMFSQSMLWNDDPVEIEEEVPDLGEYFKRLGVDHWDSIRLCRTYANYQAAKGVRAPKRNKK